MTPAPKRRCLSRTDAKLIGGRFGLAVGLLGPLAVSRLIEPFQFLDELLVEHPFWFTVGLAGTTALCSTVMFIGVAIQAPRLRPRMSDRHKPIFFRYWWAVDRLVVVEGMWFAIASSAGFSVALLLGTMGIYPTFPRSALILGASINLFAGLAVLKGLNSPGIVNRQRRAG